MPIQAFMDASEWQTFEDEVQAVSERFPDVVGILAVGSFVHTMRPPADWAVPRRGGTLGTAYEAIRNPGRRRPFPSRSSDLDIWLCLRDGKRSLDAQRRVELGGMALLEELAGGTLQRGTPHWQNKKEALFEEFYKKPELYSSEFVAANRQGGPWMAEGFKTDLEEALIDRLPGLVSRIHEFVDKRIPGSFIEVRAFPESLFHLRPDDAMMPGGVEDRMPFPRIADDQWIGPDHASFVLYTSDDVTIYPFRPDGRVLGAAIDEHIRAAAGPAPAFSYGGLLLKPDATQRDQVETIMEKVSEGVATMGGRIIAKRRFERLTDDQVEALYPLLRGQGLEDSKRYLTSGPVIGFVIETPLPEGETLRRINEIKGPRVGDRSERRLFEGRITTGSIRGLLPLPGDEVAYRGLLATILAKRSDPSRRFSDEQYAYYSRNLVHTPDNSVELNGLLNLMGLERPAVTANGHNRSRATAADHA